MLPWIVVAGLFTTTMDVHHVSAQPKKSTRSPRATPRPQRVIIFQIDNLHYEAAQRLNLTNVLALAAEGTSVDEAYVPVPWHQTTGDYGKVHTTSLPNPVTFAGTLFLRDGQPMIQSSFRGVRAHIANSEAYGSLNPGFTLLRLDSDWRDDDVIAEAKKIYSARTPPTFSRIVLQDANDRGGALVSRAVPGTPWKNDIYASGSPFIKEVKEADALLGDFVAFLKDRDLWDDTLFILAADGASRAGWHPIEPADSSRIPMIFVGPGIARGKVIPYAETIDIVPTIAKLMNVKHPNPDGGTGRVLVELAPGVKPPKTPRHLARFNETVREFLQLSSRMRLESNKHPRYAIALMQITNNTNANTLFYGIDRIMDWHEAGTMKNLVETNALVLQCLEALRVQETGGEPPRTPGQLGCWQETGAVPVARRSRARR